jgi:hypothetical protein
MAAHIVVARTTDLRGMTSQASATREAPAQAELRPTCAGTPRVNLPIILAPIQLNSLSRKNGWSALKNCSFFKGDAAIISSTKWLELNMHVA